MFRKNEVSKFVYMKENNYLCTWFHGSVAQLD